MPENQTEPDWACDLCGRAVRTTPGGHEGMTVDVAGRGPEGEWSFWEAGFCSQEHAAEWLARPLPSPPGAEHALQQDSWWERAMPWVFGVCLLWSLALMGIGAWTVAQFVLDRV